MEVLLEVAGRNTTISSAENTLFVKAIVHAFKPRDGQRTNLLSRKGLKV